MFNLPKLRRWAGATTLLVAGLAAGCRHSHEHRSSKNACTNCTPPPAVALAVPAVPAPPTTAPAPTKLPAVTRTQPGPALPYESIPFVSNERYLAPPPPEPTTPAIVVERPNLGLPPAIEPAAPKTVVIPSITGQQHDTAPRSRVTDMMPRRDFSHTPDYTVLTGELSYLPHKDQWRVRFADIDEEDRYGGSVTLDAGFLMKGFQTGQSVRVIGEMIDKEARVPSPRYRVKVVSVMER